MSNIVSLKKYKEVKNITSIEDQLANLMHEVCGIDLEIQMLEMRRASAWIAMDSLIERRERLKQ